MIAPMSGSTDANGQASTILTAGTTPGTAVVTAQLPSDPSLSAQSMSIGIGGGVVSGPLTFSCDNNYIGGFQYNGLSINCTVLASDESDAWVPNTQVIIMTEAGTVPSPGVTVQNDMGQGELDFTYTTGCPWPADVLPEQDSNPTDFTDPSGQPQFTYNGVQGNEYYRQDSGFWNQCNGSGTLEHRTVNPRDGWADMVAYTIGQTGKPIPYADGGQGVQPADNLGEPYVDINDNGSYDGPQSPYLLGTSYYATGEPFYDYDQNGVWTPPDGKWHAQAAIWAHVQVKWTGTAIPPPLNPVQNTRNNSPGLTTLDPGVLGSVTHQKACASNSIPGFNVIWADTNGSCPASDNSADALTDTCADGNCSNADTIPLQDCTNFVMGNDPKNPGLFARPLVVQDANCACIASPPCTDDPYTLGITLSRTLDENVGTVEAVTMGISGTFTK
jgi:hypothetical protein